MHWIILSQKLDSGMKVGKLYLSYSIKWPILNFVLVFLLMVKVSPNVFSQSQSQNEKISHFSGNISLTNNGISLIPTFSLGRPAAIFERSLGGERLSFDPEIRFAMDGQPWSFILWWRYKIIQSEKFNLHVGTHPGFLFRNTSVLAANGQVIESMEARRYFAGEIVPSYIINDKVKLSFLYLASRSLGPVPFELNQFLSVNSSLTNLKISDQFYFNARPQFFYLKINERDGYFVSASFLVGKKNLPVSFGSIISKKIISTIATDNWVWNVGLIYSFNNDFIKSPNPVL
jgi:hypothetical protein